MKGVNFQFRYSHEAVISLPTSSTPPITITGTNFGPTGFKNKMNNWSTSDTLVSAYYNNSVDGSIVYSAINCSILTPNTIIVCKSNEGVGFGHIWTISVAAPDSRRWWKYNTLLSTDYESPTLFNVSTTNGPLQTVGGEKIYIWGQNLGPLCQKLWLVLQ